MRSGELADLAGVTVRTLRHYHQIGLLPEPARGGNGYRDYSVHDLVAVLRIRRMAELGIPLDEIGDARSTPDGTAATNAATNEATLDALDAELVERIAQLQARRATIAALRSEGSELDLPPEFARFARLFGDQRAADAVDMDRELFLLLSHLSAPAERTALLALLERLAVLGDTPVARAAQRRFDELTPDAGDPARAALAREFFDLYAAILRDTDDSDQPAAPAAAPAVVARLVAEYTRDRLNAAQADVLARIEARLGSS